MKRVFCNAIATFLFAISAISPAHADVITVGTRSSGPAGENSLPFGGAVPTARYQQIYGASAFGTIGEPIYIDSLRFFADAQSCGFFGCFDQQQSLSEGNYVIRLSTTSKTVSGLSTTSLNANLGTDVAVFFNGKIKNTLTVNGQGFRYDSSMGNLIMDVQVTGLIPNGTFFAASNSTTDNMARMYSANGGNVPTISGAPAARSIGLVTEFGYTRESDVPVDVPEPASIALMGTGLALAGLVRRRRTA